jgi:uncharacterized Zn finger protein
MSDYIVIKCSQCGREVTGNRPYEQIKDKAILQGFQFRPGGVLCGDCGSVKQMNVTSAEHLTKKGVKKI